ncbi:hypothetical protein FACS1894126_1120 [Alphaproteobacteria bacterium]|nr:hypothetical protein FACS1894126_1120 [Alphaproteobacteria bacterium]
METNATEVIFAERMPEQFTKQYVKKLASYTNGRGACKKDLRKMPIAHILWHDLVNLTKERGEENEKNFTKDPCKNKMDLLAKHIVETEDYRQDES